MTRLARQQAGALLAAALQVATTAAAEGRLREACVGAGCVEQARRAIAQSDLVGARRAYLEACKAGVSSGCEMYRQFVRRRMGGSPEASEVEEIFGRLCRAGAAVACGDLGDYLRDRSEVRWDPSRARQRAVWEAPIPWWRAACYPANGGAADAAACFRLGRQSTEAHGAPSHLKRACDLGYQPACSEVEGVLATQALLARCFPAPSAPIDAKACLVLVHESPSQFAIEEPPPDSRTSYLVQACAAHHGRSCAEAATDLMYTNPRAALAMYRRGCNLGDPDACAWLREDGRHGDVALFLGSDSPFAAFASFGTGLDDRGNDTRTLPVRIGAVSFAEREIPISAEFFYVGSYRGAKGHGAGFREWVSVMSWPREDQSVVSPLNLNIGWSFEGEWFRRDGFDWTHGPVLQNRAFLGCWFGLTAGLSWPLRRTGRFDVSPEFGVFVIERHPTRHGYHRCPD